MHDFCKTVLENIVSVDSHVYDVVFRFFAESFELCFEDESFVVEGEHM